jgi:GNAT superfamily N-acetyltransferase
MTQIEAGAVEIAGLKPGYEEIMRIFVAEGLYAESEQAGISKWDGRAYAIRWQVKHPIPGYDGRLPDMRRQGYEGLQPHGEQQLHVAYMDDEVAGVAALEPANVNNRPFCNWLSGVYVAERFRKQGIGGKLIAACVVDGDTAKPVKTRVFAHHKPMQRLLRAYGFHGIGETERVVVGNRLRSYPVVSMVRPRENDLRTIETMEEMS